MMSSGWKLPSTIWFQFQRKKLAYLKNPRIDSDIPIDSHRQRRRFQSLRVSLMMRDRHQSRTEVIISSMKNQALDL